MVVSAGLGEVGGDGGEQWRVATKSFSSKGLRVVQGLRWFSGSSESTARCGSARRMRWWWIRWSEWQVEARQGGGAAVVRRNSGEIGTEL